MLRPGGDLAGPGWPGGRFETGDEDGLRGIAPGGAEDEGPVTVPAPEF